MCKHKNVIINSDEEDQKAKNKNLVAGSVIDTAVFCGCDTAEI